MKFNIYTGSNLFSEIFIVIMKMLQFQKFYDPSIVKKYEKKFSNIVNKKYGFAFGSGRMSLYAGLKSIGLKKNDEIIIPAFTCVVVANAIKYTGAKIVYCDISKQNFNINLKEIKNLITKKTKAIYIQHTFGNYCNFNSLIKICRSKKISIVEDCAHYFPERKKLDSFGKKSDFIFFSTDHSKFINTHLGGIILTDNKIIAEKLKKIKYNANELNFLNNFSLNLSFIFENLFYHPRLYAHAKIFIKILSKFKILFYFRDELFLNKPKYYPTKINSYQALIGIKQLENIENNIKHRKKIVGLLNNTLNIKLNSNYPLLRYSFLIKSRENFVKFFSRYIDLDIWYETVLHGRQTDFKKLGYKKGSCKNAEFVCKHIVNFPTHLKIDFKYFKKILSMNKTYIKNNVINE